MTIPNSDLAIVDIRKLRDYCLNLLHDEGKHKARLFAAIFGIGLGDAEAIRDILLEVVKTHDAQLGRLDEYGQRFTLDFLLDWRGKRAMVRSGWIIELGSNAPKLTTCFPL